MTEAAKDPFSGLPHTRVDAFTEEQLAKLASLGIDPDTVATADMPIIQTKLSDRGDDGWMIPTGVEHNRCPVVQQEGEERMILPDGTAIRLSDNAN